MTIRRIAHESTLLSKVSIYLEISRKFPNTPSVFYRALFGNSAVFSKDIWKYAQKITVPA